MSEDKYGKYYIDWWNIRKSTIYGVIATVLIGAALAGGSWWAARHDWFVPALDQNIPKDAARIVSFEGEVRVTRAATRETIIVKNETYVAAGDTIQTLADGRAVILMIDGTTYTLKQNSTMVVKDSTSLFGRRDVRVMVDDGQVNVRTDEQPQDTKNIVEVADSENKLLSNTDASFNADSQTNGGEIRISRGGVETTVGNEKTTIGENEFASVSNGKLSAREKLLAPPRPSAPANSASLADATGSGVSVTFSWQAPEENPIASYYLQVSKSPIFAADSILVDKNSMTTREFRLAGLTPGNYYWRVRATSVSGQTTNWNDAWKFVVVRPGDNVAIDATDIQVQRVGGNIYIITGRTSPGMIVRSSGRDTFAGSDGSFRLQISSPSAEAAIEISDDRGNRTGFLLSLRNGSVLRRY